MQAKLYESYIERLRPAKLQRQLFSSIWFKLYSIVISTTPLIRKPSIKSHQFSVNKKMAQFILRNSQWQNNSLCFYALKEWGLYIFIYSKPNNFSSFKVMQNIRNAKLVAIELPEKHSAAVSQTVVKPFRTACQLSIYAWIFAISRLLHYFAL